METWPPEYDRSYLPASDSEYWNAELETMDPDEREQTVILPKLQAQMAYAYAHSPFYRKKWDSAGIHPQDIRSLKDFEAVPLVTKDEIRRDQSEHPPFGSNLCVTGDFIQSATGATRFYVAGDQAATYDPFCMSAGGGGSYTNMKVLQGADLDGQLQIVLMPEYFDDFNYTPEVGDTFDFFIANDGVTVQPTLDFIVLVSAAGAGLLSGLTLTGWVSEIGDPDTLLRISEQVMIFTLEEGGTILRGTLTSALNAQVPVPGAVSLLASALGWLSWLARRRRQST